MKEKEVKTPSLNHFLNLSRLKPREWRFGSRVRKMKGKTKVTDNLYNRNK